MKEKRKAWKENMSGYAPEKLVFLDESGINVNMTRFYARSKGGSRAVDAVPLWKPQNTTVLSSIQLNGETAYTTYSGGTTSERFVDYLRNILIPTLSPDSIVVMDNMRSHHTQAIKDLLEQAGVQYLYLPPYSPDLNPIEKMWSKLKAFLRQKFVCWRSCRMLFVLLSKRFLHMTVLDGFAFVAIHANLLDHYKNRIMDSRDIICPSSLAESTYFIPDFSTVCLSNRCF